MQKTEEIDNVLIITEETVEDNLYHEAGCKYAIGMNVQLIKSYGFSGTSKLVAVFFPRLVECYNQAFSYSQIRFVFAPRAVSLGKLSFFQTQIEEVLPLLVTLLDKQLFDECEALEYFYSTSAETANSWAFSESSLIAAYLPALRLLSADQRTPPFQRTARLETLYTSSRVECANPECKSGQQDCFVCKGDFSKVSGEKMSFGQFAARHGCYRTTVQILRKAGQLRLVNQVTDPRGAGGLQYRLDIAREKAAGGAGIVSMLWDQLGMLAMLEGRFAKMVDWLMELEFGGE